MLYVNLLKLNNNFKLKNNYLIYKIKNIFKLEIKNLILKLTIK